jgi:hypothetical protein
MSSAEKKTGGTTSLTWDATDYRAVVIRSIISIGTEFPVGTGEKVTVLPRMKEGE